MSMFQMIPLQLQFYEQRSTGVTSRIDSCYIKKKKPKHCRIIFNFQTL